MSQNVHQPKAQVNKNTQMTNQDQSHTQNQKQKNHQPSQSVEKQPDTKSEMSQEQIPDHFYDSDIASVCEKDFLSDNEPPKDIVQERKLLYKQKLLHVFKTIIRVGTGIDKPARYDLITTRFKEVQQEEVKKYFNTKDEKKKSQQNNQVENPDNKEDAQSLQKQKPHQPVCQIQQTQLPPFYSTSYLDSQPQIQYNIGDKYEQIQRLITSMKRGQTALFELEHLVVSKKSNIKIKSKTEVFVIHVYDWTTVIDLDGDKKLLKYVLTRGEGAFRVALYDKINFQYRILRGNVEVEVKSIENKRLEKEFIEEQLPNVVWRVLTSMKDKESVRLQIIDEDFKQLEGEQFYEDLQKAYNQKKQTLNNEALPVNQKQPLSSWILTLTISKLIKVDDVDLDGRLLKETLVRGVSTAKPQSSSLVYYALKFIDRNQNELKKDPCFDSDWWEDYGKLDELQGIRKNYLDDYSVSKMLRKSIKRMKPAEIAIIQCRDKQLFEFGCDYEQMKQLINFTKQTVPDVIKLVVRIYNFTEAKTAFNMEIDEKIVQSRRKKQIALKLLAEGKIQKALKKFQSIVAFYSSQKINQQAYDQKVSALMNAILCYMKLQKYQDMIKLCNEILLKPRHGHQSKDIKIVGPGHAKVEGSLNKSQGQSQEGLLSGDGDTRRIAVELVQNQKILDKCLYRKALALVQMGECGQALKSLQEISESMRQSEQVKKLYKQAFLGKQKYEQKSKKIFKNMFG